MITLAHTGRIKSEQVRILIPKKLLENPNCDLALVLEIFYLTDGQQNCL